MASKHDLKPARRSTKKKSTPDLTPYEKSKLKRAVADSLRDQGFEATVTLDPSGYPEKYRLFIVSKDFE